MAALEARAIVDLVKMGAPLLRSFIRRAEPRRAQRVVVIPGFGADDRFTWPLRQFVKSHGYSVMGWGLGTNQAGLDKPHRLKDIHPRWNLTPATAYHGEAGVPYVIDRLIERMDQWAAENPQPIALIGWSLGGFMAREVARDRPELISQVITLGSPVVGGPKYTLAAKAFTQRQHDLNWIEQTIAARETNPITVPITAIVSQTDGIVGYHAAIDQYSPDVEHLNMDVSHLGFPYNTQVWKAIADALNSREESLKK